MNKFSVEIEWIVQEINNQVIECKKYDAYGNTVDEVLGQEMKLLGKKLDTQFTYETYGEHNGFRRHERFFHEGQYVGVITVAVKTP